MKQVKFVEDKALAKPKKFSLLNEHCWSAPLPVILQASVRIHHQQQIALRVERCAL